MGFAERPTNQTVEFIPCVAGKYSFSRHVTSQRDPKALRTVATSFTLEYLNFSPAYIVVAMVLLSIGGAHFDNMPFIAGNETPCLQHATPYQTEHEPLANESCNTATVCFYQLNNFRRCRLLCHMSAYALPTLT
jgi:hypothetical protein